MLKGTVVSLLSGTSKIQNLCEPIEVTQGNLGFENSSTNEKIIYAVNQKENMAFNFMASVFVLLVGIGAIWNTL